MSQSRTTPESPASDSLSAQPPSAEAATRLALPQSRAAPPRKKASTACRPCQMRKTKCSGDQPCTKCVQKGIESECLIDSNADLRRRGASNRRLEDLLHDRQLLDGILDTIRAGDEAMVQDLCALIRRDATKLEIWNFVETFLEASLQDEHDRTEMAPALAPTPAAAQLDKQPYVPQRTRPNIRDLLNEDSASS